MFVFLVRISINLCNTCVQYVRGRLKIVSLVQWCIFLLQDEDEMLVPPTDVNDVAEPMEGT
jgi:hypothetical protein